MSAQTRADRAFSPAEFSETLEDASVLPRQIGRYRVTKVIGEGGMGIVYRAEQTEPVQRAVAIKLLKIGMDSRHIVARFNTERQALAMMNHPNVAHVYDAGATDTGRPYFVMELVPGEAVTVFCDRLRLSINQRLELFQQACDAVQHAHQKGIIHRDIKPGNVLVVQAETGGKPRVKVIDFGIAKALEQTRHGQSMATESTQLIGTPEYMSPEQAEMIPGGVDTRSDVYSLGVLLYEMLSGLLPFDAARFRDAGPIEVARIMREVEAGNPSTRFLKAEESNQSRIAANHGVDRRALARRLRGDLDSIVMKAIEKDRSRRYASASEFGEDVSRYLRGQPVLAGPTGIAYRTRKLAKRHRVALISAAAILLSLIAGLAVASWQLVRARHAEQAEVVAHAEVVQKLWDSYLIQIHAGRATCAPGQRLRGLAVCADAARIRPSLAVRNEAIACMAMDDVEVVRSFDDPEHDDRLIVFEPSMQRYAQSAADGAIAIHSVADNRVLCSLPGIGARVGNDFSFSRDGKYLIASYRTKPPQFRVWNLQTQQPIIQLSDPEESELAFDFAPDSRCIAVGKVSAGIDVYELPSGEKIRSFARGSDVGRIAFSPDGNEIAVAREPHELRILSAQSGEALATIDTPVLMETFTWNPSGTQLAACGDELSYPIHIFDRNNGHQLSVMRGHISRPVTLNYICGGDRLASEGWDSTVRIWNPTTGELVLTIDGSGGGMTTGADSNMLSITSSQQTRILHVIASREFRRIAGATDDRQYSTADTSPDGTLIAAPCTGCVRFWNASNGTCAGALNVPAVRSVVFTPDGRNVLLSVPGGMRMLAVPHATVPDRAIDRSLELDLTGGLALSADGHTIVFDTGDGTIMQAQLNNLSHPSLVAKQKRSSRFVAVSADGQWAASSSRYELSFKIWDLKNASLAAELPAVSPIHEAGAVTFSADGKWLVTEDCAVFSVWEVGSWRLHARLPREMTQAVGSACFSPDSKLFAAVVNRGDITLFDTQTWSQVATLAAPSAQMHVSLIFSHDGQQLIASTLDPYLGIWDLTLLHRELAPLGLDW